MTIDDNLSPDDALPAVSEDLTEGGVTGVENCDWVRGATATVTRNLGAICPITCYAVPTCNRLDEANPYWTFEVQGTVQLASECEIDQILINGVAASYSSYVFNGEIRFFTTDGPEIELPYCGTATIEVTSTCGDVCTYRIHSCEFCNNLKSITWPAFSHDRTETYSRLVNDDPNKVEEGEVQESAEYPSFVAFSIALTGCESDGSSNLVISQGYRQYYLMERTGTGWVNGELIYDEYELIQDMLVVYGFDGTEVSRTGAFTVTRTTQFKGQSPVTTSQTGNFPGRVAIGSVAVLTTNVGWWQRSCGATGSAQFVLMRNPLNPSQCRLWLQDFYPYLTPIAPAPACDFGAAVFYVGPG